VELLERMAQAIRNNPSITVRELARRMGYSEERSVYYWLKKAGFLGIRDFRNAVLRGTFPPLGNAGSPRRTAAPERIAEGDASQAVVPLLERLPRPGAALPAVKGPFVPVYREVTPGSFAFRLAAPDYAPLLMEGDILVVDPSTPFTHGDYVVLATEGDDPLVRRAVGTRPPYWVHPVDWRLPPAPDDPSLRVMGKIVTLIRLFEGTLLPAPSS